MAEDLCRIENKIRDIFIQCLVFNTENNYSIHACWIRAYDSPLSAPHLVRFLIARIQRVFVEQLLNTYRYIYIKYVSS